MNITKLITLCALSVCSIPEGAAQNLCLTSVVAAKEIGPDKADGADGTWNISSESTSMPGTKLELMGGAQAPVSVGAVGVQFALTYDLGLYSIKGSIVQTGTNEVALELNHIGHPSGEFRTVYFEGDAARCAEGQIEVVLKYGCGGCAWAGVNGTQCTLHGGGTTTTYTFTKSTG